MGVADRRLVAAGVVPLLYLGLVVGLNASCGSLWTRPDTWLFVLGFGACALALVYVGLHPAAMLRTLVQIASGIIGGLCLQPSSAAIAGILTVGLSLGSVPRTSFLIGVALLLIGIAAGFGTLAFSMAVGGPPARC